VNWPNAITIIRILLIPLFVYEVLDGQYAEGAVVFIIAALSDALDGFVARFWKMKTRLGTFLDPLADKLLVTSAYVILGIKGMIPLWLVVGVISRDVIIVLGALVLHIIHGELHPRPHLVSKVNTFFQLLTVILALSRGMTLGMGVVHDWVIASMEPAIVLTALLTLVSGVIYILTGLRALEEKEGDAGVQGGRP
jgi:cardiolipin synthase (CMP-forming)